MAVPGLSTVLRLNPALKSGYQLTILRHRHAGMLPRTKPDFMGISKTKMFEFEPKDHTPQDEKDLMNKLTFNYREHTSAVTQFLYKDWLKSSDTGEAAKQEAIRAAEEQEILLEENRLENERVAAMRTERLKKEREMEDRKIEADLAALKIRESENLKKLQERIREKEIELENSINLENLDQAIERAMADPVDHEFAIDKEGHIYRGRYTKSLKVPLDQREKMEMRQFDEIFIKTESEPQKEQKSN